MNILIIAGHGAGDSGAVGNNYFEAGLTRETARLIPEYLSKYASVTVGDTSRNWYEWLKTNSFDFTGYDYVLEIHFNAGANDEHGDGIITGSEMYVTTSETQVTVEEDILHKMSLLGFTNRGVKRRNYSLIYKVKAQGVSSALLEVAFIDDKDDMELFQRSKKRVAMAISEGIIEGFGLLNEGDLTVTQYEELKERLDMLENEIRYPEMIYNYIDDNMPEWARPTIEKLVEKGWLRGNDRDELGLTDEMLRLFVVNDRAGLYD